MKTQGKGRETARAHGGGRKKRAGRAGRGEHDVPCWRPRARETSPHEADGGALIRASMLSKWLPRKTRSTQDFLAVPHRILRRSPSAEPLTPSSSSAPAHGPARVPPLARLPEELLVAILRCLDASSIASCNQACRCLRQAIAGSMLLQYTLELRATGMRDGPRTDPDQTVQLHRLLAHEAAWRELRWGTAHEERSLAGALHPAAVSGSTLALLAFGPGPVSGLRMVFQQFASALRGTRARSWELSFQLLAIHDTLLDESQGLLILLEHDTARTGFTTHYHMVDMRTGRPHPLAVGLGVLEVPDLPHCAVGQGASGLYGDYIGATIFSPDKTTRLVLWNWKTGAVKVDAVRAAHVTRDRP
ncbi:hypothetical protein BC834DRAFT_907065 [Gloeopeniophorella convolvens]|nr:hypothetical protein BC834DRAFT_907065 [Gloeopeniophorella convolvens]